jgi:hypothetical protein
VQGLFARFRAQFAAWFFPFPARFSLRFRERFELAFLSVFVRQQTIEGCGESSYESCEYLRLDKGGNKLFLHFSFL